MKKKNKICEHRALNCTTDEDVETEIVVHLRHKSSRYLMVALVYFREMQV